MKIALIGVSGQVGSRVLSELLQRGHQITGIARHPGRVIVRPGLSLAAVDATDSAQLAPVLAGHDAVISAARFLTSDANALLDAVRQAKVPRLLVVGGAGSLEIAPGKPLLEVPEFPEEALPEAEAGLDFLNVLRGEKEIDWTFMSPAADFAPGDRTGTFRLGDHRLPIDTTGRSWITMEDYAIALVDELESHAHPRQRFSVGY